MAYVVPRTLTNGKRAYLVRYHAPDGRLRSKQFARRRDADLFASSVEIEVAHGLYIDPAGGKETLAAWVDRWWPTTVNLRETSRARDGSVLRIHVLPTFGNVPLGRIEHLAIREWIAELTAKGYKPTTVHKCHQVLAKTLRGAVDARLLRYNPADNVPLPRIDREEMRFLAPARSRASPMRSTHGTATSWCSPRTPDCGSVRSPASRGNASISCDARSTSCRRSSKSTARSS